MEIVFGGHILLACHICFVVWWKKAFYCLFTYCSVCHHCFHFIPSLSSVFFFLLRLHLCISACGSTLMGSTDFFQQDVNTWTECHCCNFTLLWGLFYVKSLFLGSSISSCQDGYFFNSSVCDVKLVQKLIT